LAASGDHFAALGVMYNYNNTGAGSEVRGHNPAGASDGDLAFACTNAAGTLVEVMRLDGGSGFVGINHPTVGANATALGAGDARVIEVKAAKYPQYILTSSDGHSDEKTWRIICRDSHVFQIQSLTDAYGGESTALQFTRVGAALTTQFPQGVVTMSNYGSGTATFSAAGVISSVSDERLKNILGPFSRGLPALMGLRPILFRWKDMGDQDTENVYAGFSAQNILAYIPEAVGKSLEGLYSISDAVVLAAVVNAVQAIAKELDELRDKLELEKMVRIVEPFIGDAGCVNSDTPKRRAQIAAIEAARIPVLKDQDTGIEGG
jgi:hypothetical protein